jgi:hypothetical protein
MKRFWMKEIYCKHCKTSIDDKFLSKRLKGLYNCPSCGKSYTVWHKGKVISIVALLFSAIMSVFVYPQIRAFIFGSDHTNLIPLPTPSSASTPTPTPIPIAPARTLYGATDGLRWEYNGDVAEGKPHGFGRKEYENGSWFDGEWYEGRYLNGEGMFIFISGDWFRGEFRDGVRNNGVLYIVASGTRFEGTFVFRNGRHYRHGYGRIEWPNGDYYDGEWHYDMRHGRGVSFHAESGERQDGIWIDNAFQQ